jgi:hypothetical protein
MSDLMKIHPVGAALIFADRRTDMMRRLTRTRLKIPDPDWMILFCHTVVKCPILLLDFNQIWSLWTDFS